MMTQTIYKYFASNDHINLEKIGDSREDNTRMLNSILVAAQTDLLDPILLYKL